MKKVSGNSCPSCQRLVLTLYFEDGGISPCGFRCSHCGVTGFFAGKEMFAVTPAVLDNLTKTELILKVGNQK